MSRSSAHRNAASVLPDPVGAWIRVCSPDAMAGQPRICAAVGAGDVSWNQVLVAGAKEANASTAGTYHGPVTDTPGHRTRQAVSRYSASPVTTPVLEGNDLKPGFHTQDGAGHACSGVSCQLTRRD